MSMSNRIENLVDCGDGCWEWDIVDEMGNRESYSTRPQRQRGLFVACCIGEDAQTHRNIMDWRLSDCDFWLPEERRASYAKVYERFVRGPAREMERWCR